jgi:type I restriction enzyme S subunit
MSFPRYPKYKDSGVEFFGEVPAHWELKRLGAVCSFQSGKAHEPFVDDDGEFICVNSRFVSTQSASEKRCTQNLSPAQIDDVLMVMSDLPNGRALARAFYVSDDRPYAVNQRVCIIRALSVTPRFVFYLLDRNHVFLSHDDGFNQTHLSNDVFTKFPLLVPSPAEQIAIAAFLDAETAKIDELVAEQRRLIELLKEKRQAVISHAVTKGLNPKVPLKSSGIEWLDDVPQHWSIAAVRFRYTVQLGKMLDTEKITGKHLKPYLRVFDVQWGEINVEDLPQMDFDPSVRERFRLTLGDLLINEGGSYPGRSAIWNGELEECYFQKALHRLRPCNPTTDTTRFFFYIMAWATAFGVFTAGGNESTIEHLPAEKFRKYRFAFPPMSEQLAIANFLDRELSRLDALTNEAEHAIELLQERRTALISAAVTGKIDVREFAKGEFDR